MCLSPTDSLVLSHPFPFSSTMVTTNGISSLQHEFFEVRHLNMPSKFEKWCRSGLVGLLEFFRPCGANPGWVVDLEVEEMFLTEIEVATTMDTRSGTLTDTLAAYAASVDPEVGHHHLNPDLFEDDDDDTDEGEEDEIPSSIVTTQRLRVVPVRMSPALCADMLVALRCKLGSNLDDTRVNRDIVEKHAYKLFTNINGRHKVASANVPHIVNAYFSCDAQHAFSGRRRKTVRPWLLRLLGFRPSATRSD